MKKQAIFSILLLLLASLACEAVPVLTPSPVPTRQSTPKPSATWTPTVTATTTPTMTATQSSVGEFQIGQILALDFERNDWQQAGDTLVSQHIPGCAVVAAAGGEFPRTLPETVIAGFTWQISYSNYLLNLGDQIFGEVNVEYGENPTDCRKAAETLLKSLHSLQAYATAGKCANAPKQRLKVGDNATLRTSSYLRTEPRWDEKTRIRLVSPTEKLTIQITGGPICAIYNKGEYSFWQVELSNGKKGWMAEGDLKEYYLVPKK